MLQRMGSVWKNGIKHLLEFTAKAKAWSGKALRLGADFFLQSLWGRAKRLLVCFDQFLNVLILNGREDESLSSRFYRWSKRGGFWHALPAKITDTLFFFDVAEENGRTIRHCEKSYRNEMKRTGFPLEMQ